jgi:hypothetical protein
MDFDKALIEAITLQAVEELKADVRTKQVTPFGPFFASGRLESSIYSTVSDSEIAIYAEDYYKAGEQGKPKGTRVSPTVIREWLRHKNIAYKKGMEYAISRSIYNKGTVIFRQGGNTGLFSDVIGKDSFFVKRVESELQNLGADWIYKNIALELIR